MPFPFNPKIFYDEFILFLFCSTLLLLSYKSCKLSACYQLLILESLPSFLDTVFKPDLVIIKGLANFEFDTIYPLSLSIVYLLSF